mgnify:CR=1 FL=1
MEGLVIAAIIIGIVNLYRYYKQNQAEEATDEVTTSEQASSANNQCATRNLVFSTLKKMGCEYYEEDELRIRFTFQGETFIIDSSNDCLFINVYDPWWFELPMSGDIEDFARMQKAVNLANCKGSCTVLYTYNEEEGLIGVHSRKNIIFVPQITELDKYLASILDGFFKIQRLVMSEMDKIKNKEICDNK